MTIDPRPSDRELLDRLRVEEGRLERAAAATTAKIARLVPLNHKRRPSSRNAVSEHELQAALFARINDPAEQARRPALAAVFAVPNGGKRALLTAVRLKLEGVKPGVPDVWCPAPRGGYCGLVIEMKRPGGTTSPAQADWLAWLAREGWRVALHTTTEGAWAELVAYLDAPPTVMYVTPYAG